jgi:glucose/arabinose dehydrogenase
MILSNGQFEVIAEGFNVPLTGITYRNGDIYVSHRGVITIVKSNRTKLDIISGLPSYGDYCNNKVTFGPDGKMYFGQGTATNSGVVGLDNEWIFKCPFFHDYPGSYIMLNGQNFITKNVLMPFDDLAYTGAFSPYAVANLQRFEILKSAIRTTGSILKTNPDGSGLEMVAWGFRNPIAVKFDQYNRLFVANQGYDNRGSRPVANAPDEIHLIIPNTWYGWPDYVGGESITDQKFAAQPEPKLEFLFTNHPSVPPKPFAVFPPNSNIMGFDYNNNSDFGNVGDFYIAEFGSDKYDNIGKNIISRIGHRVTKIDINTGEMETFAINKTGFPTFFVQGETPEGGGFGRPVDIAFGPDGAMYIIDFAITTEENPYDYLANTGVIWKISKT